MFACPCVCAIAMKIKPAVVFALLSLCWHIGHAAELSPAEVEASIQHSGAKSTIADLQRREQWQTVTEMIDTGDSTWVGLVPRLARGTDDITAEDLARSLSHALPKNPRAVLSVLNAEVIISPAQVCGTPFSDADTIKDREIYKREALHALEGIEDHTLSSAKSICMTALKRAE